jgi:hypothetical protein
MTTHDKAAAVLEAIPYWLKELEPWQVALWSDRLKEVAARWRIRLPSRLDTDDPVAVLAVASTASRRASRLLRGYVAARWTAAPVRAWRA